jgi:hypothetical protein
MGERRAADDPRVVLLVEQLRMLPTGEVIAWGADTGDENCWIAGWCDVWAPDLARTLGWSWVWTVATPEQAHPEVGPLHVILPAERTDDSGQAGWTARTVSSALEDWVAVRAGRTDLRFVHDPTLYSDWALAVVAREGRWWSPPVIESDDGVLHQVDDADGWVVTTCGLPIEQTWVLRTGDISAEDVLDCIEDDGLGRGCAACAGRSD